MSGKPQRLIALLAVLQVRRVTTAEALAAEFGVSVRTILRDIQALIDADIPVLTERGKYGGISLLPGSQADLSKLTASEADVIRAVGFDLGRAARLGAETAARSAAGKLTAKRRAPLRGDRASGGSPPTSRPMWRASPVTCAWRAACASGTGTAARRSPRCTLSILTGCCCGQTGGT
jgi:predicted DNA-binding transcriptional regulator YafY